MDIFLVPLWKIFTKIQIQIQLNSYYFSFTWVNWVMYDNNNYNICEYFFIFCACVWYYTLTVLLLQYVNSCHDLIIEGKEKQFIMKIFRVSAHYFYISFNKWYSG